MSIEISAEIARADSQKSAGGILDGLAFIGHVGPKGGEADGEDELVFPIWNTQPAGRVSTGENPWEPLSASVNRKSKNENIRFELKSVSSI